jgi:hypothetical protein
MVVFCAFTHAGLLSDHYEAEQRRAGSSERWRASDGEEQRAGNGKQQHVDGGSE